LVFIAVLLQSIPKFAMKRSQLLLNLFIIEKAAKFMFIDKVSIVNKPDFAQNQGSGLNQ
jgi:hypothetical protein